MSSNSDVYSSIDEVKIRNTHIGGVDYNFLADTASMRSVMVEIRPGKSLGGKREHEGEEFKYVIEGRVEFTVGDKEYSLGPGEWLWHKSTISHGASNIGKKKCKYMTFVSFRGRDKK